MTTCFIIKNWFTHIRFWLFLILIVNLQIWLYLPVQVEELPKIKVVHLFRLQTSLIERIRKKRRMAIMYLKAVRDIESCWRFDVKRLRSGRRQQNHCYQCHKIKMKLLLLFEDRTWKHVKHERQANLHPYSIGLCDTYCPFGNAFVLTI